MEPEEYARISAVEDDHWWYTNLRALAASLLAPWLRDARRILDAGCGPGGNGAWLSSSGQVVGVDVAPQALTFLRRRHPEVIPVRGSVGALPLTDGAFDIVLALTVLHALDDDDRALHELARVLAPGGALLVVEPAFSWLRRAHDTTVHGRRRYRRDELCRLVGHHGLVVRRATYAYSYLVPPAAALAAVARARRSRFSGPTPARPSSDVERRWLDRVFRPLARMERQVIARRDVPFGTSVVVVATTD